MERRNRYKNGVRPLMLWRLALGGMLLLATGTAFVLVRNDHVLRADAIGEIEEEVSRLNREIEMWELRIAGVRDRQELSRRLRWVQSDLFDIDGTRIIEIDPVPGFDAAVAGAAEAPEAAGAAVARAY